LNSSKSRNHTITRHLENVGFFIAVNRRLLFERKSKTMLLSTKKSNHTFLFPQTSKLFGNNGVAQDCRVGIKNRSKVSDYQSIISVCNFRKIEIQRVKEIKWVFV
jgi:hypothetical protein